MEKSDIEIPSSEGNNKSSLSLSGDLEIDHVAEKKLIRKLDLHIVPMVMLLYLLSFLDRVNIGNARLYKMEEDLGLTGNQFQIATSILFVTYILFETPSNLVLKKFTPSRWIAGITTAWGIIATLTGVVQNFAGLVACRVLLGAVEAGLFPGMTIYLTFFYTRRELALRIGYLFVSAALAGACGGLLAYAIGHMNGVANQHGWRWILILEGLPTLILGIATFFLLADNPHSARYLSPSEKDLMRVRRERQTGATANAEEFSWADARKAITDWKVWLFASGQFGADTVLYGYSTFLPTIISGLGSSSESASASASASASNKWTPAEIQALTIPCYCLGALTYLLIARLSDAHQMRGMYSVIFGCITIVGYGLLMSPEHVSAGVRYFGCFLVATGLYVIVGLPLAWLPNNSPRYGKRTTASGIQLTIGNSSGIMAPFLYPTAQGPRYLRGHAVSLGMVAYATLVYGFLWWWHARANRRREEGREEWKVEGLSDEEIAELGDESPRFRYTI
ncbi:MAG: hypothetical protein M1825_001772 [Sarcosagium campestre]|nr:MAG: hypothetical protein M1825_001772 [Sarcosagium campestre]